MKIYVIQSKSGIMMNVSVSEKNQINGVPVKKATYGILAHDGQYDKICEIGQYLDIKS